jgi:hypothetical protein
MDSVRPGKLTITVLESKSQITRTKLQIISKFQIQMTKTVLKNERPTSNVQRRIRVRPRS